MTAGGLGTRRRGGNGAGAGRRLDLSGSRRRAQGSTRRRAGASANGVEDAGDRVGVEDRRDGLEGSQAAIRAGADVDVVDPAEQVGIVSHSVV